MFGGENQTRRKFLKTGSISAGSYWLLTTSSWAQKDEEIRYVAGWRMTNREEVRRRGAKPNIEEKYDTVKKSRREKVEAQKDVAGQIAKDLKEKENRKTVSLIKRTLYNKSDIKEKFEPAVELEWMTRNGRSPDISPEEARDRYSGRKMGESESEKKSEVAVKVRDNGQAQNMSCGYEEKFDSVVPSGVSMTVERFNRSNVYGTTGPACYDRDYGTEGWLSVWHLFNENGETDLAYSPYVETNAYFGRKERQYDDRGIFDKTDMAVIHSNNKGKNPRYYLWGDESNPECPQNYRAPGGRSNEWIENNQGSEYVAFQGAGSRDRRYGELGYRPNNIDPTKPEVVVRNETGSNADSGGPIFELDYSTKYGETVVNILGVAATKNSRGTWGNTYQAFQSYFNIVI
jgi:hypothetical protein